MRRLLFAALCAPAIAIAGPTVARDWLTVVDRYGTPQFGTAHFAGADDALSGTLDGDPLTGSRRGASIHFTVRDRDGVESVYSASLRNGEMRGTVAAPDPDRPNGRIVQAFSATVLPDRPAAPRHVEFVPTAWSNEFSAYRKPVATIWPGDTVHTSTLDSGGVDEHGITRALYGNPQTGPFYVGSANPGDVLAIHIQRLRLNRDYADSLDSIVDRALRPSLAADAKDLGKPVRWRLDRQLGTARPETPSKGLQNFTVAVRTMLGCVAVAPAFGYAPISTGDSGRFGGNMDFNGIVDGSTVYLPVQQPGALLYLGDGHAAQGDGETTQYALETSMDVEFTVDVIHHRSIATPRVRSEKGITALGFAGSADDALRVATAGLAQWLQQDYGLTLSEVAQVFGSALHYTIAEIADRNVGVAAWIDAATLTGLKATP